MRTAPRPWLVRPSVRRRLTGAVAILGTLSACAAETTPSFSESNTRARAVLDRVVEAAGGAAVLDSILTLALQYAYVQYGRGPDDMSADAPVQRLDVMQARDFTTGRSYFEFQGSDQSGDVWDRVVVSPLRAFRHDFITDATEDLGGSMAELAEYSHIQLSWYVYQSITDAQFNASLLRFVGDTVIDGAAHEAVRFLEGDGDEVTLYVDSASSRITRRSTRRTGQSALAGELVHTYTEYQDDAGIPIPYVVVVHEGNRLAARYDVVQAYINVELSEEAFEEPG